MNKKTDRTAISIKPELYEIGKANAARRGFENSFSAYVAWLIRRDEQGGTTPQIAETPPSYGLAHVATDAAGRITDINPAFTRMCGYTLDELLDKKPGRLLQGPATEKAIVEKFSRAIKKRTPFECTLTNYHKNGSPYRVRIRMRPTPSGFEADEEVVASRK